MSIFGVPTQDVQELRARMHELGVVEKDLAEQFIRSSGPGGQNVNKVSSCVRLIHKPTGIFVKVQEERSQGLNRFTARWLLLEKLAKLEARRKHEAKHNKEKLRRQNRKMTTSKKEEMLKGKHLRAEKKSMRRPVNLRGGVDI
jgi:peptide chain release factor